MSIVRPALTAVCGRLTLAVVAATVLAGCVSLPEPDPTAEVPYCQKRKKGLTRDCTTAAAPSLNADAQAKRFAADPRALTVYVVRRSWADGINVVRLQADGGPIVETLPETMVRLKMRPGTHALALEFKGQRKVTTVKGEAGEVKFVRLDGEVTAWSTDYGWADELEGPGRERARKTRLVADLDLR